MLFRSDDIHLLWVLVPDHQVGHLSVFVVRVDQLLSELVVPAFDQFVFFRFIQYFPDVYIRRDGKLYKIRNRWTPKEYMQNSMLYGEEQK